jgi:glycosyltransferase involved in cell wall biosynthesis
VYGEEVQKMLRQTPNVDYRGGVPPDEAMNVIGQSAVFLSTSAMEGFPNTFLHAWSCGVPVLSLGVDLDGLITRERLGFQTDSIQGAVDAIPGLVQEGFSRRHSARYIQYVQDNHSEDIAVRRFLGALGRG